jgi:hypothetical protein
MPSDQNKFKTLIYKLLFNGLLTSIFFYKKKLQFIPLNILLCSNWSSESLLGKIWSISLLVNFLVISIPIMFI